MNKAMDMTARTHSRLCWLIRMPTLYTGKLMSYALQEAASKQAYRRPLEQKSLLMPCSTCAVRTISDRFRHLQPGRAYVKSLLAVCRSKFALNVNVEDTGVRYGVWYVCENADALVGMTGHPRRRLTRIIKHAQCINLVVYRV